MGGRQKENERHTNRGTKEGNVLFNNILNRFYLQIYGIRHMVKDHLDSESGNLLPSLPGLFFSIRNKDSFICTILQTGSYTTAFVTPGVEQWLKWNNYGSTMRDRSNNPLHHDQMLYHGAPWSSDIYLFLTHNRPSVFRAGVSLNTHSFIHSDREIEERGKGRKRQRKREREYFIIICLFICLFSTVHLWTALVNFFKEIKKKN